MIKKVEFQALFQGRMKQRYLIVMKLGCSVQIKPWQKREMQLKVKKW